MLDTCFCYVTLTRWQDRGESPFDPVYDKVLNGLNLVARHAAMPLLDALLAWRKDAESMAQRAGMELVVLRKKVCRVHSCCVAISFVNMSCFSAAQSIAAAVGSRNCIPGSFKPVGGAREQWAVRPSSRSSGAACIRLGPQCRNLC